MWSSANGSGIRSHAMPARPSSPCPAAAARGTGRRGAVRGPRAWRVGSLSGLDGDDGPDRGRGRRAGAQDALPIALCIAASSAKVAKLSRAYAIVVGVFHGSVPTARHAGGSRRPMSEPCRRRHCPGNPDRRRLHDFRSCARVRADDARDSLLRGRGPALSAAPGTGDASTASASGCASSCILRGKRLGLALSEIRELFDIYALTGNEAAQLSKFLPMLSDRRAHAAPAARGHRRRAGRDRRPRARLPAPPRGGRRRLAQAGAAPARALTARPPEPSLTLTLTSFRVAAPQQPATGPQPRPESPDDTR